MVGGRDLTDLVRQHKPEDTFYVYELGILQRAYQEWLRVFPTIQPFVAVKAGPDPRFIKVLADLGSSFDCASPAEIDLVLGMGVEQERIIYANPCKRRQEIAHAKNLNIKLTTFDSVCELEKLAEGGWSDVVIRIRSDDPGARCCLGTKYGAEIEDWPELFTTSKKLGLNVVGVSFHVGSFASSADAFVSAISKARAAVEMSWNYGFKPTLIDIGGGFSSTEIFDLGPIPEIINNGLALYFPETTYEYIAEPGRYFFEHVATLVTPVIGMKGTGVTISESLYGAFNCVLFDHAQPTPSDFIMKHQGRLVDRMLFGNTCDGGDCISKNIKLPENLEVDDWIVWPRMGAYTFAATTTFNGFKYNERYGIYV